MGSKSNNEVMFKDRIGTKIVISFIVITLLIVSSISFMVYRQSYDLFVKNLGNKSLNIARVAAKSIDVEKFVKLNTIEDEKTDSYHLMREKLNSIREVSGAKYLYTMKKNSSGEYIFVVDGIDYNSENISHIGEIDENIGGQFDLPYAGKSYVSNSIEVSEWGKLLPSLYPIKDTGGRVVGFVGADYDVESEYEALGKIRAQIIVMAILAIILVFAIALIVSKKISDPIVTATGLINKIASFDLSYDDNYEVLSKNRDETGSMARSLDKMRGLLGGIVTNMKSSSEKMSSHSEGLYDISKHMDSAATAISNAVHEVTVSNISQAEELTDMSDIFRRFSKRLEDMVGSIDGIDFGSKEIQGKASRGSRDMKELSNSVESAEKSFNSFTTKIDLLGEKLDSINTITVMINAMANQTGLLALNASIESARAGEEGKAFAVVADEIKKLSEQSKSSADSINILIKDVIVETSTMIAMTEAMSVEHENQTGAISAAMDSFRSIISGVDDIVLRIEAVCSEASSVQKEKNNIVEKIDCASAVAEEVAASAEEISSSLQELSSSTDDILSSAGNLAGMTQEMAENTGKFRI